MSHPRWTRRDILAAALLSVVLGGSCAESRAGDIRVDPAGRSFRDASGQPVFLVGYYGWAAVHDGSFIDHPARYAAMIDQGAHYGLNYIRISLGINRFTDSTVPRSWDGKPTPVPFLDVNGKADLDRWDPAFWKGLRDQCAHAKRKGMIVHVSFFDGVELRGGSEAFRYVSSFWNPANQVRSYYPDPDSNHDGNIDETGEFYQIRAFQKGTGIGRYQRRFLDKAIRETAGFDNVFYEIGNELLSSPSDWNAAVVSFIHSRTKKAVTQCGGGLAPNIQGWSQHEANTPAEVKANVVSITGRGRPAWEDPDGPALSNVNVSPDDLRRAAWYAFAGGEAGWGGFTADFWDRGHGFSKVKAAYYGRLLKFVRESRAPFWSMAPRPNLVSNSGENSCLCAPGTEYVAYILKDGSATLDLSGVSGRIGCRTYDPRTSAWTDPITLKGGAVRAVRRPAGAEDWVIFAGKSLLKAHPVRKTGGRGPKLVPIG